MKKSLQRAIVICALTILLFSVVFLKDVSLVAHEILALLFIAVLMLHLLLERKAAQRSARHARAEEADAPGVSRRVVRGVHLAAGAVLLLCVVSGLLQSRLLPFLNVGGVFPAVLHHIAFCALLVLVTVHALLHAAFLRQILQGFFVRRRPLAAAVCAGCAVIVAVVLIGARLLAPPEAPSAPRGAGTTPLFGAPEPTPVPDFPSDLLDGEAE